jgi:6-phosphofructokinase 1
MMKAESLKRTLDKIDTPFFKENLSPNTRHSFRLGRKLEKPPGKASRGLKIGILTEGENVSGMNMAIRAVARLAMNEGIQVIGIKGGFQGLTKGRASVLSLEWGMLEMKGIMLKAGTLLGVSNKWIKEEDLPGARASVADLHLDGLVTIGNHRTFQLARKAAPGLGLPILGIPATLNCDIRGTDWSIGMDSSANDLMMDTDRAVDNAHVRGKICIVHVKGDNCGSLVNQVALAGGVDLWINLESTGEYSGENLKGVIRKKVENLKKILDTGKNFASIIFSSQNPENSEKAVWVIEKALKEAGIDRDIMVVPLESHQGGVIPTAFDRVLATRLSEKAFDRLLDKIKTGDASFEMVGI